MKSYVFSETNEGKETILFESKSTDSIRAEQECIEWVKQNCTEFDDHWEFNGEWVGLTN